MGKPLILVGSVTNAIKSRNILLQAGIHSEVERASVNCRNGGCGYCVYVPDRPDEAEQILLQCGIRINGRGERGDTV